MLSLIISASLFSLIYAADNHKVKVGNDGLNFDPNTVKAAVGDTIEFQFYPMNHSVAQANYDRPCEPMSGGSDSKPIFSGFFPVDSSKTESDKMFSMMVNSSDPIWLYCSQAAHCKMGQVMVINPKYAISPMKLDLANDMQG
jgi:plastocyanin